MSKSIPIDQRIYQIDRLTTEAQNPASTDLDRLSPLEIVYLMNDEDRKVPDAVLSQAPAIARAIEAITRAFREGGRLIYVGAGTSGRLGVLDAAECPPTFGTPPEMVVGVIAGGYQALVRAVEGAEDRPEWAERDLEPLNIGPKDVVCGIATSGRTPYVIAALAYARRQGATTIGLACNADAVLTEHCDIPIVPVVGPEVLSGSTRLKAGTATKLILNMLTTGAMVGIGKTYGNLMVDLKATNTKLRLRATRIVSQLLGISREAAAELLEQCDWEVKTALVAGKRGVDPETARALLHEADGHVRVALGEERVVGPPTKSQPREHIVVGVDGGGSVTRAVVAEVRGKQIEVLGRAEGAGANANLYGFDVAAKHVTRTIFNALRAAQCSVPIDTLSLCLAGAGTNDLQQRWQQWFSSLGIARHVYVATDIDAVFAAANRSWGLCIISGTGVLVEARSPKGQRNRAGGWGWLLGDPGSGFWLGQRALQLVAEEIDQRRKPSRFSQALLDQLGGGDPRLTLRQWLYQSPPHEAAKRTAGLATTILQLAADGDSTAQKLTDDLVAQLCRLAACASRPFSGVRDWPIILSGGLLRNEALRSRLAARLRGTVGVAEVHYVTDPAQGAIRLVTSAGSS